MPPFEPTPAQLRLLETLKRAAPASASELAEELGLTPVAVRQHLQALAEAGLVASQARPAAGRGRPTAAWQATEAANAWLPDAHGDLTVDLLRSMRGVFGEEGLGRILAARGKAQLATYREAMPVASASLKARVEALAALRTREGYMASVVEEKRGQYLLVEHHCPICVAARSCVGLCANELEVFRGALGRDVAVERTEHLLEGDARCAYRIRGKGR